MKTFILVHHEQYYNDVMEREGINPDECHMLLNVAQVVDMLEDEDESQIDIIVADYNSESENEPDFTEALDELDNQGAEYRVVEVKKKLYQSVKAGESHKNPYQYSTAKQADSMRNLYKRTAG